MLQSCFQDQMEHNIKTLNVIYHYYCSFECYH